MARVRKARRGSWCLRIAVLLLLAFVFMKGMQVLAQIQERQTQIDEVNRQIAVAQLYNEDLRKRARTAINTWSSGCGRTTMCGPTIRYISFQTKQGDFKSLCRLRLERF